MKLKLKQLKPNPHKSSINNGKLNETQVKKILANMEKLGLMGSIPVIKKGENYYLVHSHHRVEALKRKYGVNYEVECTLHDFDDEQMLRGMVIENLTQRGNDFREEMENVVAIKKWLEKTVVTSRNNRDSLGRINNARITKGIGVRQISDFLQGALDMKKISELLNIKKNIPENLLEETSKGELNYTQIATLARLEDKEEINDLAEALKKSEEQRVREQVKQIMKYKETDEDIKKQVRSGELDIARIEDAETIKELKETYKEGKNSDDEDIKFVRATEIVHTYRVELQAFMDEASKAVYKIKQWKRLKYNWFDDSSRQDMQSLINSCKRTLAGMLEEVDKLESSLEVN